MNKKQNGFGESALFPIFACLGICFYLVFPNFVNLYKADQMIALISMAIVITVLSIWLASNLFADFANLLIIIVVAVIWNYLDGRLVRLINIDSIELMQNIDFSSLVIISVYIFLHALVLTVFNYDNAKE